MFDRNLDFSIHLLDYAPEKLFTISKVLASFDLSIWRSFLNSLIYENAIFLMESIDFKADKKEKSETLDKANIIQKLKEKS